MGYRWGMLAVLFVVRLTMAFQFQSVAAVAPLLGGAFNVGLADTGVLIGMYFAPGVALALPGGAIGQRFGDKTTVLSGMLLMIAGGLAMAFTSSWSGQIIGRLIAGTGGVLLNVQMTKMVADWFSGREIATAMAIFVNSWPAGIAISLLTLPSIGIGVGISAVHITVAGLIGAGMMILAAAYRSPTRSGIAVAAGERLDRKTWIAVIAAGSIWGLFNVGFAIIFSFGPSMLVERGWSIAAAGSATSIVLWLTVLSVPLGGFLADLTKRSDLILVAGCAAAAILMMALPRSDAVIAIMIGLGMVCGLPAGPIMSLPTRVLRPSVRAIGMGLFFTIFYIGMMLGPVIGGACAKWTGTAGAAFDFGAAMILVCPLILAGFRRVPAAIQTAA
jgi:MFS family permease